MSILCATWDARLQWYNIGLELEIHADTLDLIQKSNHHSVDSCFTELLNQWLKSLQPVSTWQELARALRSPAVGHEALAHEILSKVPSSLNNAEEDKHIAAIERAIKNKGKLDHTTMQGVFLGPARSGKSSLIKRLLKEELFTTSPSTGATDKVIQVSVRKSSSTPTSVFESSWLRLTYSSEAV